MAFKHWLCSFRTFLLARIRRTFGASREEHRLGHSVDALVPFCSALTAPYLIVFLLGFGKLAAAASIRACSGILCRLVAQCRLRPFAVSMRSRRKERLHRENRSLFVVLMGAFGSIHVSLSRAVRLLLGAGVSMVSHSISLGLASRARTGNR